MWWSPVTSWLKSPVIPADTDGNTPFGDTVAGQWSRTEGSTAMGKRGDEDGDADVEFTKVTISMPRWMHEDLRRRARRRGISVTELMRRAVALDAVVFDPDHPTREIVLRDGDTATERILHPL